MNKLFKSDQWTSRPLVEVATLQRGYDLPVQDRNAGPFPIFAANGPVGFHDTAKCEGPGVVTGRSGTIGKVQFVEGNYWPLNTSLYVTDFHGNHPKWVYYMLQSFGLEKYAQGAGVPTLNRNLVHHEPVLVPPLEEQRRIAAILDHAETLRTQRRTALALLDSLTQSLFIDMFGDPAKNTLGLPTKQLGELGDWHSGGTPPRSKSHYFEGDIPWFSSGELESMYVSDSVEHISNAALKETATKLVPAGSLMMGMYDTAALKTSIALKDCSCNQAIAFSKLDPTLADTAYVYYAIVVGREHFRRLQRGVRQKNLNLSMVREIRIPHPPLPLQQTFATRIASIEALKATHRRALAALDALFAALQQRAFAGAL